MKPKFCIIDNSVSFTGAFKCALQEAEVLSNQYDFLFIVPKNSSVIGLLEERRMAYYSVPMLEISRSAKQLLKYVPRLLKNAITLHKILRKEQVAILQVNDFYNLMGVVVKVLGFKGRLLTYVRFLPSSLPAPLRRFWTHLAQRYSYQVIAVSDAVKKQLPVRPNIIRIYDAIELDESLPSNYTEENDSIEILYLANYIPGKGLDYAVRAIREVIKQHQQVVLRFVGSDMGLVKNKVFKQDLHSFVMANGMENHVIFNSFQNQVEPLIKQADIVLNFSEAESFSMTCAEASFYGRPVIVTRCGGPEEIIEDGVTGLLVENKNIGQMTNTILKLVANPELRKQMGEAGRLRMRMLFNKKQYADAMKAMLKSQNNNEE